MKSNFPIIELGKHVRQTSQRNRTEADIEVFSVTNSEGFTRSTDYFSKEVFSKDVSNYKVVCPGQFAYNPSRINVGSIDYLRYSSPVLVSPLYIVFECDKGINSDYLLRYLKSSWGNAQIRANTEGAVRDSLKFKGLESIKLPLPTLHDQIRIAHLLGKVEELIAQRKQHLQQLDDLLKSVFLEMFGDPVRNEKDWATEQLGDIASIERGRFSPRPRNDPKFYGGEYPFIQTGDISRSQGRLREYTQTLNELGIKVSKEFKVGTVVIAIVGATIGETALLEIPTYAPDSVIGITPKTKDASEAIFIEYVLRFWKPVLRAKAPEAARANINIETLRPLAIVMPPNRAKFSEAVIKVEGLKAAYQSSLSDLETLYGSLSQQAFKGEVDLSCIPLPADQAPQTNRPPLPEDIVTPTEVLNSLVQNAPPESRSELLARWFNRYLANSSPPDVSLDSREFLEAAWQTLQETRLESEGESPALTLADYDALKDLVFAALEGGSVAQTFAQESNRISLHRRPADWGSF